MLALDGVVRVHALQHGQLGDVHAHARGEVDVVDGREVGDGRVGG